MPTANEQIGAAIREVRKMRKVSQDKLSIMLDVTQAQISYYEAGQKMPSIITLQKIADIFGVSINRLLPTVPKKTRNKK